MIIKSSNKIAYDLNNKIFTMRDAQKQCLSLRQLCHYAYQHNVHALSICESEYICAPIAKKWMNNFLFNPFNFCVTGRILCTWSSSDCQQLNICTRHTFALLHLPLQKFWVQGCTYFHVITWNIKLVHFTDSNKIAASSFSSRQAFIV